MSMLYSIWSHLSSKDEHKSLRSCTNHPKPHEPATASCSLREPEFLETPERQWLVIPPHRRPNLSLSPSLPLSLRPHLPSLLHSLCAWKDVCGWSRVAASPGADPTIPSEAVVLCPPPPSEVSCTAHGGETRRPFPLCAVDRQKTACQVTWRTTKKKLAHNWTSLPVCHVPTLLK